MADLIDRQELRKAMYHEAFETDSDEQRWDGGCWIRYKMFERVLDSLPSAQLGQRYTNEELMIFQHGISLSLLSKRSAQHWRYDENTATEIKFLERLYEKVSANMRGGQNE